MKNFIVSFFCLFICSSTGFSKEWELSDTNLDIRFNDQTALINVLDKRCGKIWEQSIQEKGFEVGKISQSNNSLNFMLAGKYPLEVRMTLSEESALEIELSGNVAMSFQDLAFPSAFKTTDKKYYLLETDGEGMLLPVDDTEYPIGTGEVYSCGGGLSMAWMGIVDDQFQKGYMAILETPFDAKLNTVRVDGLISFESLWMPSMGKFGYQRKVTYHFFDKGGYVAQCKAYRDYVWKKNRVVTLKEKQQRFPAIEMMIGAVHIYLWDTGREVGFAKELKKSGIDKAFILWDPNHIPYPVVGYDDSLKRLNYASGVYDLYTDIHLRDTAIYEKDEIGPMRYRRTGYPGMFDELVARKEDGKTYSNSFGHTICPATIRPQMENRIERELKEYHHEAYFLDVYQANGLFECYSANHSLNRQQYAEEIIRNYKMIEDKYHQFLGGEWGADFTGSSSVFAHGMMTLQRTWFGSDIVKKGTIYYYGDWRNNARPSQMVGTRVAPDKYLKYSINEYTRVPLFELVYHDAIVTSWRWEDCNHHTPEIWWKKDLFNMLYGSAPLWNMDRNRWEEYKQTFIKSYNNICPWLQKIGHDEMVSHRFISPDHKVQESVFSSGQKVVVNFGDNEFVFEGKVIKPRNYITTM